MRWPALAALVVTSGFATGVEASPERAEALFERGKQQLREGDWTSACASFEASMAEDPSVSTSIKIARCRVHDHKLLEGRDAYLDALRRNGADGAQSTRQRDLDTVIRSELAAVERRLPRLHVKAIPIEEGADLTCDGHSVPLDDAFFVEIGKHEIHLATPGFRDATASVTLAEGETRTFTIELVPARPAPPPTKPRVWNLPLVGGATLITLGAAELVTCAVLAVRTRERLEASAPLCNDQNQCLVRGVDLRRLAVIDQTRSIAWLAAGSIAVGLGVGLVATARQKAFRVEARVGLGALGLRAAF